MNNRALPGVTVQQLEYLVAAVDSPTWAEAAASLDVSPSALSQGLTELERRLGRRVFRRQGRRRVLDESAEPVLAYGRDVLARTRDLGRWLEATAAGRQGRLRLGMIDAAAVTHFPGQLRQFRAEQPDLDFLLSVGPSGQLLDQLRSGELDLAVMVRPAVDPADVTFRPALREPLAVYAPPGAQPGQPVSQWGPWVSFPASSHTRQRIERELRSAGADFTVVAESHQPDVIREMVRLDLGWTVLPVGQAESGSNPLERYVAEPQVHRDLVFATRRDALPNPVAERLTERLASAGSL